MVQRIKRTICIGVVGVASASGISGASAAEQTPSVQAEEIVVTAQRRPERLQDVPISVSVVSAKDLSSRGVNESTDLGMVTPGLLISSQSGSFQPALRGIVNPAANAGNESPNSVYVDGFYYADLPGLITTLNNVERIEVLKGPQGTLFGRNSTGGLIQIITRTPTEEPRVDLSVGYGSYDTTQGSLYISGGVAPHLAADIAAVYNHQAEGFGKNLVTGADAYKTREFAARSKWHFTPTDNFSAEFAVDYSNRDSGANTAQQIPPGSLGIGGVQHPANYHDLTSNIDPLTSVDQWGVSLNLSQDFNRFVVKSLTSYRSSDSLTVLDQDSTPATIVHGSLAATTKTTTQEFQIMSNDTWKFSWIAGVFYMDQQADSNPLNVNNLFQRYGLLSTRSIAGYAQTTYPVLKATNLTLGLRYTGDRRTYNAYNIAANGVVTVRNPALPNVDSKGALTWRVVLDHHITDDVMVFASYNRGFKSGVFNTLDINALAIKPEILDAYEAGIKSDWFDKRLRLNSSIYYYDYTDIQISQATAGVATLVNAAGAEMLGAEIEAIIRPVENMSVTLGTSIIDGKYSSFPNAPFYNPTGVGGNVLVSGDATDKRLIRTPHFTFNASIDYAIPTNIGEFGITASYYRNSGFFWEPDNRFRQEAYDLVNAQVRWTSVNERWRLRVFGRNLADTDYYQNGRETGTGDIGFPGAPRTYGFAVDLMYH